MTTNILSFAAVVTLGVIVFIMLPEIGKRTDIMKAPPSFYTRNAKLILPLMALFVAFSFLANQANSWGWP